MSHKFDEPPAYNAGPGGPQHPQPAYQGAYAQPQGAYNQGGNGQYYQNPQMGYYQPQGQQGGYPQGGYQQGGYPPQQGGYYGQQQGYYPQGQYQDRRSPGIVEGLCAGLACCCCLDLLF